jgi:hypothetical protein
MHKSRKNFDGPWNNLPEGECASFNARLHGKHVNQTAHLLCASVHHRTFLLREHGHRFFWGFRRKGSRFTTKFDRLIVLSKSSLLGWFLHVSLIVIIKGRSPMEVSLIVIIKQVSTWLSPLQFFIFFLFAFFFNLISSFFHHFSPNLSNSDRQKRAPASWPD